MATKAAAKSPRKASPRKAAPRKAASRPRAADATRGDAAPVNGAVVASAPGEDVQADNGQVRESALPQDNSGMIKSPYPKDTPTYIFFPQLSPEQVASAQRELMLTAAQAQEPIIIPKYATLNPKTLWLHRVWHAGPLVQAFEWMTLAGVPNAIQQRVFWMDDDAPDEYQRFWDGWFGEAKTTQGESGR